MSLYTAETMTQMYKYYINHDIQGDEVAFTYYKPHNNINSYTKAMFQFNLKTWRKRVKQGIITFLEDNNMTVKDDFGREWYCFVLQHTDEELDTEDPIALFNFGQMVDGCVYYFSNKDNRDKSYKYLMGLV